jgi:glycosyltransferase involved in cell wall biosynthesis
MNLNQPVVSVIIPTFNRSHTLPRAVKSVLEQDFEGFEVIVIDDASEDDTQKIIHSFNDPRIKYIRLDKNMGAAAARNVGISFSKGKYIAFQDSDNVWMEGKLKKQMEMFIQLPDRVGVLYSGILRISRNKREYVPDFGDKLKSGDIHVALLRKNFVDLSAAVVRRKCFHILGMFDEHLPCYQDWELWIRLSQDFEFYYLDEVHAAAYYSEDSISINPYKQINALRHILQKHQSDFSVHKKIYSKQFVYLGHLLCSYKDIRAGRKNLLKAVKMAPLSIKISMFLILSLFGSTAYRNFFELAYNRQCEKR